MVATIPRSIKSEPKKPQRPEYHYRGFSKGKNDFRQMSALAARAVTGVAGVAKELEPPNVVDIETDSPPGHSKGPTPKKLPLNKSYGVSFLNPLSKKETIDLS